MAAQRLESQILFQILKIFELYKGKECYVKIPAVSGTTLMLQHLFNSMPFNNLILITNLLGNIRSLTAEETENNFSNLPKIIE